MLSRSEPPSIECPERASVKVRGEHSRRIPGIKSLEAGVNPWRVF